METVESYDSHTNVVWKVLDGWKTIAICYSEADAKACKEALEKLRLEKEREESIAW